MGRKYSVTGWAAVFVVALIAMVVYFITQWTDRSLDFVLSAVKHQPVDVPTWLSFLVTLVFNAVIILFNIIVELFRLVV